MKFIRNKFRVSIPIHIIKDTMRRVLNLSFKKGKLRPIGIDYIKQFSTKSLFAVRLVKEINSFSVSIKIDETLFSRTTKSVYSWLEKGKEWTISNIWWSNSISLLTAILSTGTEYAASSSTSVKGKTFANFLKGLKNFIQKEIKTDVIKLLFILDNAPTHHSKIVKSFIEDEWLSVVFIPSYSPELAPIEKYFSLLKGLLQRIQSNLVLIGKMKKPSI